MPKSSPEKLAYMRRYRLKNAERINKRDREYYWAHHEELKAYQAEYRKRRRETMTDEERRERNEYQRMMYAAVYKGRKYGKAKAKESES